MPDRKESATLLAGPFDSQAMPQHWCPSCSSIETETNLYHVVTPYGQGDDEGNYAAYTLVHKCRSCEFQWEDAVAETARDMAYEAFFQTMIVPVESEKTIEGRVSG